MAKTYTFEINTTKDVWRLVEVTDADGKRKPTSKEKIEWKEK